MSSSSYSLSKINPKLLRRIYRACRPTLNEPNLALNLEICDYINAKQGLTPRDAAIAVAKLISQRDPQTSELALALLDNLVKNCGYPFQLQISRKEFLNELVKRFPERPPPRYLTVQRLILAQIEEWYQTICRTSKYKDDFTYIRDMHRLLLQKGYIFPEVKVEDVAVLNPLDNLKSLQELQKEEAIVQLAKLQELIRRGKPLDLQEANKLMKVMAGFKDDSLQELKKQITDDVERLRRKCEILDEMLTLIQNSGGSVNDSNEAAIDLYSGIKASQPKITKIIEESEGDSEDVNDLFVLNDTVNAVLQKFQFLKSGDIALASQIHVPSGASNGSGGAKKEVNLIDFDDDEPLPQAEQSGFDDLLSDLTNLLFGNSPAPASANVNSINGNIFGGGGSIALGALSGASAGSLGGLGGASAGSLGALGGLAQPQPHAASASGSSVSGSNFDLLSGLNSPSPQLQLNTGAGLDPFGFNFPSLTPAAVQTATANTNNHSVSGFSKKVVLQQSDLHISVEIQGDTQASGKVVITQHGAQLVSHFKFLLAVPKLCKLTLKAQSGDVLYAYGGNTIVQEFQIENPTQKTLKVKWKAVYQEAGVEKEAGGVSEL